MPSHALFNRILILCIGAVLLLGLYNGFTQPEFAVTPSQELTHPGLVHEKLVRPSLNDGIQVQKRAVPFGKPGFSALDHSKRATDWEVMVSKGCKLISLMEADVAGATAQMQQSNPGLTSSQSSWKDYPAISTYGFKDMEANFMIDFNLNLPILSALEGLSLSTVSIDDGGHNTLVYMVHEEETTVDGITYQPTGANYNTILNYVDGAIIVWGAYGPAYEGAKKNPPITVLPPLRQWSDIWFLEWEHQAKDKSKISNVKYIFQTPIENSVSQSIIAQALSNRGDTQSLWPGTTFGMDTDEGKAILATPNGNGIAWFLIQHKEQLGHKTVSEVTVFEDEGPAANRPPSAVFKIVDVP